MRFIFGSLLLLLALTGVDQPVPQPLAKHLESLAYPDLARQARIEDAFDVEIEIDPQGKVSSASAVSGHPLLKEAAEKNIRTWRFDTSSASSRRLAVRYEFILEPPETWYRPESRNLFDVPIRLTVISKLPEPQP